MVLEHKFCVYCGAEYHHWFAGMKDDSHPLYRKILELHNDYWRRVESKNTHDHLMSITASNFLFKLASTSLIESLIKDPFLQDETAKQLIQKYQTSLIWFYINLLTDGYLAGLAAIEFVKDKSSAIAIPSQEFLEDEYRAMADVVYSQYTQCREQRPKEGLLISIEVAEVLFGYVLLQGRKWFEMTKDAKALESIYPGIQAIGFPAIVYGYATAIVDAKYRNE